MEDFKIIELFWARNEDAIAQTDAVYGKKLCMLANRILNNREDAEESINDTYMKTWPCFHIGVVYAFFCIFPIVQDSVCQHTELFSIDSIRLCDGIFISCPEQFDNFKIFQ